MNQIIGVIISFYVILLFFDDLYFETFNSKNRNNGKSINLK